MKLTRNEEKSGLEFSFESKPEENTRNALKQAGFRWSHRNQVWYRKETQDFTFENAKALQKLVEAGEKFAAPDFKSSQKKKTSKKSKAPSTSKEAEYRDLYERAVAAGKLEAAKKLARLQEDGPMYEILDNAHPSQCNDPENPGAKAVASLLYDPNKPTRSLGFQLDSCGFGWATVRDARKGFTKWLLKNVEEAWHSRDGYSCITGGTGAMFSGDDFTRRQELSVNGAFASGFAKVIREAGYAVDVRTRID